MNEALDSLLQQPGIWRAGDRQRPTAGLDHTGTGFAALDEALPGGGWPTGALTEILHDQSGIGELRLLMPALARLSHSGRWVAMIAPPHVPFAPALAGFGLDLSRVLLVHPASRTDALWAVEQALRAGTCGAVIAWPRQVDDRSLRRLQLAAEEGGTLGVLFRSAACLREASPAALRLRLTHREGSAAVELLKCRGGFERGTITVDLSAPPMAPAASRTPPPRETARRPSPTIRRTERPSAAPAPTRPRPSRRRPAMAEVRRERTAQMALPLGSEEPHRPRAIPAGDGRAVTTKTAPGRLARLLDLWRTS